MKIIAFGLVALSAIASPVAAETWNSFSRTQNNVYMVDVDRFTVTGDVTSALVARVPLTGEAGDYSHSVETFELRCSDKHWRTAGSVEYGPDGAEMDRYPEEGAEWEASRNGTLPEYLRQIVCDGARANPPTWPAIKAFIDAGRP